MIKGECADAHSLFFLFYLSALRFEYLLQK